MAHLLTSRTTSDLLTYDLHGMKLMWFFTCLPGDPTLHACKHRTTDTPEELLMDDSGAAGLPFIIQWFYVHSSCLGCVNKSQIAHLPPSFSNTSPPSYNYIFIKYITLPLPTNSPPPSYPSSFTLTSPILSCLQSYRFSSIASINCLIN